MFKSGKRRLLVLLLTITAMLASTAFAYAAGSKVTISGYTAPTALKAGQSFIIRGKISSTVKINRVEVGIVNAYNKWTAYKYDNKNVNAKTFDLSRADSTLKFGKLNHGSYKYRIYVHTSDGKVHIVLNQKFTVAKATSKVNSSTGVAISGHALPKGLVTGQNFTVKGKLTSSSTMKRVEVGIAVKGGGWTAYKYDNKSVNAKTFDLSKADSKLKFSGLKAGTYCYRIYAHTADGKVHIVLNHTFTVAAKTVPKSSGSSSAKSGGVKTAVGTGTQTEKEQMTTDTSANTAQKVNDKVSLVGVNKPTNCNVGATFTAGGRIDSTEVIKRIEVGIVFGPTNKWTAYKYDNKNVNAKSFYLKWAAPKLKVNLLPGGSYRYRIYVHTASGVTIALNHTFTVKPSNKPQLAVNWAKKIAADNSYSYGAKPAASEVGCYFCGTNKRTKPKGYEKTYVCLTFLGAAYAHGAGDPEILYKCQRGKMTMYSNNDNFNVFSCWVKIGQCSELHTKDLQPGDVIVDWSSDNGNGHVWMFAGGDTYVDAEGLGWSADSIAVRSGAESYLRWCGRDDSRNYVMRYRY